MKKYITTPLIIKIALLGLLFQFFLQTFVTFELGRDNVFWNIIWAWKEIAIVALIGFVLWKLYQTKSLKTLFTDTKTKWVIWPIVILSLLVIFISLIGTKVGITPAILSLRYSITGFVIFVGVFWAARFRLTNEQIEGATKRYVRLMKTLILLSFIRWLIIWLVPRLLEFVGYSQYAYEGTVGQSPPAVYYTQYIDGYTRNQFLFERPISRGFFLVAFWPLFFLLVIKNRGRKNTFRRGGLYALAILATFSRAAWIAWFVQTIILFFLQHKALVRKMLLPGIIGLVGLFGLVTIIGKDQIIKRDFSNTGHFTNIALAIEKIKEKPWFGQGAGSAGPASHHLGKGKEYNPENQYLQIWIEYGVFGFILWMMIYLGLHRKGLSLALVRSNLHTSKNQKFTKYLMFVCALGLLGLSIEGLVLHSFVDRMIVYPMMIVYGLIYTWHTREN